MMASACVTSHENNDTIDADGTVRLEGFASAPGAQIVVHKLDPADDTWKTGEITYSALAAQPYGGRDLFGWQVSVTLVDAIEQIDLVNAAGEAKLKVVEDDWLDLTTFDDGGVLCTIQKVETGLDLFVAGDLCKSPVSPVLTLRE